MRPSGELSNREARWLAIAAQGLGRPRPPAVGKRRPGPAARLGRVMDRVGTIQLDAVNVLERTQFLVPFSRIGAYDPAVLRGLTGPGRPWFEYWGHAASLLPVELYPLVRWRMDKWRHDRVDSVAAQVGRRAWREAHAGYLASVLGEVTDRGPLAASQLSDPRRQVGEWWDRRSEGRRAMELLFGDGVLAAWRSASFERVYDLTERVIAPAVLARPTPPEDQAKRELVAVAVRALGVATVADLADYFGLRPAEVRRLAAELVEAGRLVPVAVEGWAQPGFAPAGAPARPRRPARDHASLLSPFDSLIWNRARTERLFGMRYRIEIYVPAHLRTHGYYVMPLLLGDRLVARLDLKADRLTRTLRVPGAHLEPGADRATVVEAALVELGALAGWLGLDGLEVGDRGDLAADLGKAVAGA